MDIVPLDYEVLRLIWWGLLGVLLTGFAVMGGMDLGVGALIPFVAKTDDERRVLINLIGPTWEGNQVWLVLGGGAIFAAWPAIYATSFSGFYIAMIAILLALMLKELPLRGITGAAALDGAPVPATTPGAEQLGEALGMSPAETEVPGAHERITPGATTTGSRSTTG